MPDPLHETNLLRHSGRGLFLMGAFMDDLKVRKAPAGGTEVTLVKLIGPRERCRFEGFKFEEVSGK